MKQGTEFVYVKVALALIEAMDDGWSRPVQIQVKEWSNGDIDLIVKEAGAK